MALKWFEGWEGATNLPTHHARIYATATGSVTPVNGASVEADEAVSSDDAVFVTPDFGAVQNSWILGVAFRAVDIVEIEDGSAAYLAMGNTDGEQVRFEFADVTLGGPAKPGAAYYKIRVMRGSTELASSDQVFLLGNNADEQWIYFEFKCTIDNSTGSFEGRFQYIRKGSLNNAGAGGTTALTWDAASSSIDSQEQTSTGADRFTISMDTGNTSDPVAMDDIYCCDSTGSINNDYLGKLIVQGQKPVNTGGGDGDTVEWVLAGGATSTFDAWFESLSAVEDDERVTSEVATDIHLCVVEPLTVLTNPNGTIVGMRLDTVQHMETAGDVDIAQMWRKTTATAGETNSGTINVATTAYEGLTTVLELDPNTVVAWDQADLDSYQYGVRNDG